MLNLRRHKISVQMRTGAASAIHEYAEHAAPKETGGLLLGWWDRNRIVIEDITEVADAGATTNSWVRHEDLAQKSLRDILATSTSGLLGYVGDWHSHPANCGASGPDIHALKRASKQYHLPIMLMVRKPNDQLEFHAANNGRMCRIELITTESKEK